MHAPSFSWSQSCWPLPLSEVFQRGSVSESERAVSAWSLALLVLVPFGGLPVVCTLEPSHVSFGPTRDRNGTPGSSFRPPGLMLAWTGQPTAVKIPIPTESHARLRGSLGFSPSLPLPCPPCRVALLRAGHCTHETEGP